MPDYLQLIFIIVIIEIFYIIIDKDSRRRMKYSKLDAGQIRLLKSKLIQMSPRDFEYFCCELYRMMGYSVVLTPNTNDGGKDLILNKKIYVECKHYMGKVDRPIAQKLYGSMAYDGITKGIIITTGHFTRECLRYSAKMNIETIDMEKLLSMAYETGSARVLKIAGMNI